MACVVIPSSSLPSSARLARRRCSCDVVQRGPISPQLSRILGRKISMTSAPDSKVMRIQSVGHLSWEPDDDPELYCFIQQASLGLQRYPPKLADEGDGGTYYLHSISGDLLGVFKPSDEDPQSQNNPKKKNKMKEGLDNDNRKRTSGCSLKSSSSRSSFCSTSSSVCSPAVRTSIPSGQTAIREVAAYALDRKFAGVPPTTLVRFQGWELSRASNRTGPSRLSKSTKIINENTMNGDHSPMLQRYMDNNEEQKCDSEEKVGSLQKYMKNECGSCDRAPQKYSVEDVHRIGILDLRILNTDRHGGNMLAVRRDCPNEEGIVYSLVPIDHGYSFPVNLSEANFEWMYWPQARVPFSSQLVRYVEEIDLEEEEKILRKCGLEEDAICVNRITTILLKEGMRCGLTLQEIARLCCRQSEEASSLEEVVASLVGSELPALNDESIWQELWEHISELVKGVSKL